MKDNDTSNPEITPQVIHLVDLLKWALEGRLRIPRFQRDFVWRRNDMIDLFDSIANQYPIGTLFLWGADPLPEGRKKIGPLSLPENKSQWLVLDGQQRLTTLVGVLLKDEETWCLGPDEEDPERWSLFFDARPEEGGFLHLRAGEENPPSYLPVTALLDTMGLVREIQRMMSESSSPAEGVAWSQRAQEVARAIQGYRVPIVQFTTNELSIAVESFSRLNKKGRTIGKDEMFSALTYEEKDGERFHLATEIDSLQQDMIRSGFGEVDRTILLRVVLTAAGLDMYRTDWTRLGSKVKSETREKLPEAIAESRVGLDHARRFLHETGIYNVRMLPYSTQLVALAAFFGRCQEPTEGQNELLRRWFWSSSFAGWFGSVNPSRFRRLVQELRETISRQENPKRLENIDLEQEALPTPSSFDLRSARVRTLLCVLLRRCPRRRDGSQLTAQEAAALLLERGPAAMSIICATVTEKSLRTGPANRILDVAPDVRGQAKNWLTELDPTVRDEVLESHAIPPESFPLLQAGDHDRFLAARLELLQALEHDFMTDAGVTPPKSTEPAPSPIDTDDEMLYESLDSAVLQE